MGTRIRSIRLATTPAKAQVQNPKYSCLLSVGIFIFNAKDAGQTKCLNVVRIF